MEKTAASIFRVNEIKLENVGPPNLTTCLPNTLVYLQKNAVLTI